MLESSSIFMTVGAVSLWMCPEIKIWQESFTEAEKSAARSMLQVQNYSISKPFYIFRAKKTSRWFGLFVFP